MLFQSGKIVATPGALSLAERGIDLLEYLQRHLNGDWGDLCEEDKVEEPFLTKTRLTSSLYVQHALRKAVDYHRSRPKRDNLPATRRILGAHYEYLL